ncbi:MAG: hypothetical protein ACP5GS_07435 [Nitrososphaeria archaeon]
MNTIEVIIGILLILGSFGASALPLSTTTVTITFKPVNLPSGASWYVTVNGVTQSSTGDEIIFTEPANAVLTYSYGDSAGYSSPASVLNTGTAGGLFYVTFPSSSSGGSSSGGSSGGTPTITSFTATATTVQVGQSVTLTAQASTNVGSTPYFIFILDLTTGHAVASAASGTSASATVSESTPTSQTYIAIISAYPGMSGAVSQSNQITVTWVGSSSSGSGSGNGGTSTTWTVTLATSGDTLTATANPSPSPYELVIWDETSNSIVSYTSGTTLTETGITNHTYIAYIGSTSSPTGAVAESSPVTLLTPEPATQTPTLSWDVNGMAVTTNTIDLNTKSVTFSAISSGSIESAYVDITGQNGYSTTVSLHNVQGNFWSGSWTAPGYGSYTVQGYYTYSGGSSPVMSSQVILSIQQPVTGLGLTSLSWLQIALIIFGTIIMIDGLRRTTD